MDKMRVEYNNNERALIFLSMFDITHKKEQELLDIFEEPKDFLLTFQKNRDIISKTLGRNLRHLFEDMENYLMDNVLDSYINNLHNKNIKVLTPYSVGYPDSLRNLDMPPWILFCKGDISLLENESIGVVGTRRPTSYGKIITEQFCKGLVANNFAIVSGLACGVDTIAHKTALDNNGKTIAVLGGGFDKIYPAMNQNLSDKIIENGLLISEYRPNFSPTVYTFPFRNRIIAALSKGILITEAGEKSGSLHTKEYALELGKEVFAVPGNITSPMSKGSNRLIKSAQCACVLNYEDIVCVFRQKVVISSKSALNQLTLEDQLIVKALELEEKNFEQLQFETGLQTNKLNSMLTMLQIKGIVKQMPGNTYCLA